ncbi:MAG: prepilin-type N-terminal cleavage/methylation domain-containing protein [Methylobacter sp.]|nr:prepilin-type N-terminal cleavage/methylation domain-containing protein [Methylobacter sp.]
MRQIQAQGSRFKVQGGRVRIAHHFSNATPDLRTATGFTLIEVLIAMTLLSMMVVLLFASLRICAQSWEQGERKITDVNEVAVVYNFFQRHLSSAIPLWNDFTVRDRVSAANQPGAGGDGMQAGDRHRRDDAETENQDRILSFQGKKQSLQFVSVFPASAGRSGMQLFSIQPQQQDGEQVINVTLTPFLPVTEGEEWRQEEVVLLRRVSDFELAYFGADDTGESRWQDEWLEKEVQPRLVKISIGTENGIFWPEMIIELKAVGVGIEANMGNATESVEDRK